MSLFRAFNVIQWMLFPQLSLGANYMTTEQTALPDNELKALVY